MSAAIGSIKEFGVADWRAADKAEPVKNQDCRDYTMTKAQPRTVATVSNCAFFLQEIAVLPFPSGVAHESQELLTNRLSLCIIGSFPDSKAAFHGPRRGEKRKFIHSFSMRFHMYAVIKTGGKQYKVAAGEKLKVEQIPADIGSQITLDQVLAVGAGDTVKFGAPLVEGATVLVTVIAQGRHDKVKIFKMRRRKHYQKRQGHRQNYTELQIVSINA